MAPVTSAPREHCAAGSSVAHISWGVMIFAPVWIAISCVDPTSSGCPSATRMTSTFGKSGTFTGLSGFVTNGFVTMILPPGEVNRKMDHDSHSILTGPDCAGAWPAHAASIAANDPPSTQRHRLAMVSPPQFRLDGVARFDKEAAASDEATAARARMFPPVGEQTTAARRGSSPRPIRCAVAGGPWAERPLRRRARAARSVGARRYEPRPGARRRHPPGHRHAADSLPNAASTLVPGAMIERRSPL